MNNNKMEISTISSPQLTDYNDVNLVPRNATPGGVSLVNPGQSGRIRSDDLVALAQDIQKSDSMIAAVTCGKLKLIADQIEYLRRQALEIMQDSVKSLDLHRVACNFTKVPGNIYNLYERENGDLYFSMLTIEEWNHSPPHKYIGRYLLNADRSWTDVTKEQPTPLNAQLIYQPLTKNHEMAKAIKYTHNTDESESFSNPNLRMEFKYSNQNLSNIVQATFMEQDETKFQL